LRNQAYKIAETIQLVKPTINHPIIADPNDEIEKPGRIHATRAKIAALIIKRKRPRERIVIGKVRITRTGLTTAFSKPKRKAAIKRVIKVSMCIPGTIYDASPILKALITKFKMNFTSPPVISTLFITFEGY
jgi:hypothetical protein